MLLLSKKASFVSIMTLAGLSLGSLLNDSYATFYPNEDFSISKTHYGDRFPKPSAPPLELMDLENPEPIRYAPPLELIDLEESMPIRYAPSLEELINLGNAMPIPSAPTQEEVEENDLKAAISQSLVTFQEENTFKMAKKFQEEEDLEAAIKRSLQEEDLKMAKKLQEEEDLKAAMEKSLQVAEEEKQLSEVLALSRQTQSVKTKNSSFFSRKFVQPIKHTIKSLFSFFGF